LALAWLVLPLISQMASPMKPRRQATKMDPYSTSEIWRQRIISEGQSVYQWEAKYGPLRSHYANVPKLKVVEVGVPLLVSSVSMSSVSRVHPSCATLCRRPARWLTRTTRQAEGFVKAPKAEERLDELCSSWLDDREQTVLNPPIPQERMPVPETSMQEIGWSGRNLEVYASSRCLHSVPPLTSTQVRNTQVPA
jgi:hypothetical protein